MYQHENYITVMMLSCYQVSVKNFKKHFLIHPGKTLKNLKVAALNFT